MTTEEALRKMVVNVKRRYDSYSKWVENYDKLRFKAKLAGEEPYKEPESEMPGSSYYRSGAIVCYHVLRDEIGPVALEAGIDLSKEMGSIWDAVVSRRGGRD